VDLYRFTKDHISPDMELYDMARHRVLIVDEATAPAQTLLKLGLYPAAVLIVRRRK
jgi:hypothetical protein